jgi:repressor LexA
MLTRRQKATYEYIKSYIQEMGDAPTMIEIAKGIGIQSKGTVHRYVQALVKAKLIEQEHGRWRNMKILDLEKPANDQCIPVLGKIAAGGPIEAIEDKQSIDLAQLLGPQRYALKICGDSMIEEGIHDGDLVVCERCETARNGSIVVALIDNNCATLKRFRSNGDGSVTLIPANVDFLPMNYSADRVVIQGLFVGLLRLAG